MMSVNGADVHTGIRVVWLPWPPGHCTMAAEGPSRLPRPPTQVTSPQGLAPITQTLYTLKTRNGIRACFSAFTPRNTLAIRLGPPLSRTGPWHGHTAEPRPACAGPGCTSLECGRRIAALDPSVATGPCCAAHPSRRGCQQARGALAGWLHRSSLLRALFSWQFARVCPCLFHRPDPGQLWQELPHG